MPTEKKVTTKVVNSHGKKDLDLHSSQIPSRTDWSALNLVRNALKKKKEVGHLLSELSRKWSRNFRHQILLSKVSSNVSDCKIPISFPRQFRYYNTHLKHEAYVYYKICQKMSVESWKLYIVPGPKASQVKKNWANFSYFLCQLAPTLVKFYLNNWRLDL